MRTRKASLNRTISGKFRESVITVIYHYSVIYYYIMLYLYFILYCISLFYLSLFCYLLFIIYYIILYLCFNLHCIENNWKWWTVSFDYRGEKKKREGKGQAARQTYWKGMWAYPRASVDQRELIYEYNKRETQTQQKYKYNNKQYLIKFGVFRGIPLNQRWAKLIVSEDIGSRNTLKLHL